MPDGALECSKVNEGSLYDVLMGIQADMLQLIREYKSAYEHVNTPSAFSAARVDGAVTCKTTVNGQCAVTNTCTSQDLQDIESRIQALNARQETFLATVRRQRKHASELFQALDLVPSADFERVQEEVKKRPQRVTANPKLAHAHRSQRHRSPYKPPRSIV